nr:MAG TPA: hypothetical protein [Bacteriophage sp.]
MSFYQLRIQKDTSARFTTMAEAEFLSPDR